MSLLSAIRRAAPAALALEAPRQQVRWSYGELHQRVRQLAGGLRELGVGKGDVVASDLPNVCENLLLQLAVAHLGAAFASAKDEKSLLAAVGEVRCAVVQSPEASWMWGLAKKTPRAVRLDMDMDGAGAETGGFPAFSELAGHAPDTHDEAAAPEGLFASYGGSALSHEQAHAGLGLGLGRVRARVRVRVRVRVSLLNTCRVAPSVEGASLQEGG